MNANRARSTLPHRRHFALLLAVGCYLAVPLSAQECAVNTNQNVIGAITTNANPLAVVVNGSEECCDLCSSDDQCIVALLLPDYRCFVVQSYDRIASDPLMTGSLIFPIANDEAVVDLLSCQRESSTLWCPDSTEIVVQSALYGRVAAAPCGRDTSNTTCASEVAPDVVSGLCNGVQSCDLTATSAALGGDPCPGTSKYLEVQYSCIMGDGGIIETRPPMPPPPPQPPTEIDLPVPPTEELTDAVAVTTPAPSAELPNPAGDDNGQLEAITGDGAVDVEGDEESTAEVPVWAYAVAGVALVTCCVAGAVATLRMRAKRRANTKRTRALESRDPYAYDSDDFRPEGSPFGTSVV